MSVVLNSEFAGKTREIRTRVTLSYSIPLSDVATPAVVCEALWDTGADSSAISKKAAAELGLIPISWATVQTAGGECLVPIYAVDVMLPNHILIKGVKVTQADLKICDALIGMDIITLGDFLIANNGNTRFSFRIPAEGCPTLSSTPKEMHDVR